jgi:hypothetical protein
MSNSTEKKTFMVLDHNGTHEYDLTTELTDEGEVFSLFLSNGEQWNAEVRGQLELRMTDDGNGVKFDRKLKNIDYSLVLYLRILLNFQHMTERGALDREKYRVVEISNEILV